MERREEEREEKELWRGRKHVRKSNEHCKYSGGSGGENNRTDGVAVMVWWLWCSCGNFVVVWWWRRRKWKW